MSNFSNQNEKYGFPMIISLAPDKEDAIYEDLLEDYHGDYYTFCKDFYDEAEYNFNKAKKILINSSWDASLELGKKNGLQILITPGKIGKRGLYGLTPYRDETEEEYKGRIDSDKGEVFEFIKELLKDLYWGLYKDEGWGGIEELSPQEYKKYI